jgi:hypothetical protein
MTTFVHGKFASIKIGDSTQTLYDLSPITTSADAPRSLATAETSHFGSSGKEFIVGLSDGTLSVAGNFDATIDAKISAAMDAMAAGTIPYIPVEYGPAGTTTGNPKYTFNAIITNYTCSSPVGGVVTIKLDAQRTGVTTRAVY